MDLLPTPEARAALIARVRDLLLQPKVEWPKIAAEPATVGSLYSNYVIYLAAVPVLCTLIGSLLFGYGYGTFTYRPSFFGATASWLAGVFYLLYTGVPVLMRVPAERALGFTGVLIAVGLVIGLIIAALIGALVPVPGPT